MAKRSTLNDWHQRQGAAFVEQDGWLLPTISAIRRANMKQSVIPLESSTSPIAPCFSSPAKIGSSYLQGMLSNDLRPLKVFDGQQATILTQQGKVIADVRVLCSLNSFYLDFWEPLKEKIATHLNRYLVADDVEIHDPNEAVENAFASGAACAGDPRSTLSPMPSCRRRRITMAWCSSTAPRSASCAPTGAATTASI